MKQVILIGNMGANAVRRTTSEGKELMSFNVAVNQRDGQPVWFNCIGNMREKVFPYLLKGQCVCVIGDLRAGIYNNSLDLQVNIESIELCGAKPAEPSQENETEK